VRFVSDATVSGDGTYRSSDGAVRCRLTVTAGRRRFDVALSWSQRSPFARARLGHAVLSLLAPLIATGAEGSLPIPSRS
jgi:hypothetical protein